MKQILALILLLTTNVAHAQVTIVKKSRNVIVNNVSINRIYPSDNCIDEEWIELGTKRVGAAQCTIAQPLRMVQRSQSYPLLHDSPFNVNSWQGAVTGTVSYSTAYDRYLTNVCTRKQIGKFRTNVVWTKKASFQIENPNLSDEVSASYELSAMTTDEAKRAFTELLQRCSAL